MEREAIGVFAHALGGPIPHSRAATGKTAVDTEDPAEATPPVLKACSLAYVVLSRTRILWTADTKEGGGC